VGSAHTRKLLKKFDQNFLKPRVRAVFQKFLHRFFQKAIGVWGKAPWFLFN